MKAAVHPPLLLLEWDKIIYFNSLSCFVSSILFKKREVVVLVTENSFSTFIRAGHPLRSLRYQRGDVVDLVYASHPSELLEFKEATFIKCYLRSSVDVAVFIHDGVQHVLPLHKLGVVGVKVDRVK